MTPIYFPFTYVSQPIAEILSAVLNKAIVYQPSALNIPESMKQMQEKQIFDIQIPVDKDEEKLAGTIQEYKNWAQIHQGNKISFFKTQKDKIPFFNEISAHQIQSEIRKKEKDTPLETLPDPVFQSRVFLCMAQEFDQQHWEVSNGIKAFAEMEQELYKDIKGGVNDAPEFGTTQSVVQDDPGNHMTQERIKAWANLAMCSLKFSKLFITSSKAVMETIIDLIPEIHEVDNDDNKFPFNLSDKDKNPSLTIYQVPMNASNFLNCLAGQKPCTFKSENKDNVLIGFISL